MRVHLSEWEWACCGDPFTVGDEIELTVATPDDWVRDTYGEGVEAAESHHEVGPDDEPTTKIRGRVTAIAAIRLGHSVRREPLTPEQIAATEAEWARARAAAAEQAAEGATFGWFAYHPLGESGPPRWTTVYEPIPGDARAEPIAGVPHRETDQEHGDVDSGRVELLSGYLVDLDPVGRG